ncbi:hypothetical protein F2Q70_00038585 [Brassica cretica]|uniref:Uncharacterized protein n=1 Tax=Brassica cretica TaxID=69181 RepID=A0A8S9KCH1_BRACR|nr:hypothetical protein F2Q70_00038585 [Brassica cretica]
MRSYSRIIWLPLMEGRGDFIFVLAAACRSWRSFQKVTGKGRFLIKSGSRDTLLSGTHHAPAEGERAVLRARQLPVDRRQVNFLVSETVLRRSSLWRDMSGGVTNDPFMAYQEAAKVMSCEEGVQ